MNTYFEIGGYLIESSLDDSMPNRPPQITPRSIQKEYGVPAPLVRAASKDIEHKTGINPMTVADSYARARRARWAFSTAATLAMADGPIPVGDLLAIGVLGVYGSYEAYTAITQL